ncbi:hypothetical protein J6590_047208 [Homalodisca vitripennis]|nr:hypothetical protein J6590_047208 [Homalodisca vitripennis]
MARTVCCPISATDYEDNCVEACDVTMCGRVKWSDIRDRRARAGKARTGCCPICATDYEAIVDG